MAIRGLIFAAVFLSGLVAVCYGVDQTLLSKLEKTLTVTVNPPTGTFAAGLGNITVSWTSVPNTVTTDYKKVSVKLCFQKQSQVDRPWRKTNDELFKDKSCAHDVGAKPFSATENSVSYMVKKDVPTAHYYVRAYVLNDAGAKIAYGESDKALDLNVTGITGRHASIDIAAGVFSAFSVIALAFFFYLEKKKSKRAT